MDLGDRGGGHRGVVEAGKKVFQGLSEFALDDGPGFRGGKRRQAVLQIRQIGRKFLAQKIGTGGQRLAKLDKTRPCFVEGPGQPLPFSSLWPSCRFFAVPGRLWRAR